MTSLGFTFLISIFDHHFYMACFPLMLMHCSRIFLESFWWLEQWNVTNPSSKETSPSWDNSSTKALFLANQIASQYGIYSETSISMSSKYLNIFNSKLFGDVWLFLHFFTMIINMRLFNFSSARIFSVIASRTHLITLSDSRSFSLWGSPFGGTWENKTI